MKIKSLLLVLALFSAGLELRAQTNLVTEVPFLPKPPRPMYAADIAAFVRAGGVTNGLTTAQRDREIYRWQHFKLVSNGVTYVQTGWRYTLTNNLDYARFWWLASMGDRYGFTLPVSPDLAAAKIISNATVALVTSNVITAGYIQLDGSVASYIFSARTLDALAEGKPEADWAKVPPAFVPVKEPVWTRFGR